MKNAGLALILGIAISSFFIFSNARAIPVTDEFYESELTIPDTVPHKKIKKSNDKRTPYDSFGKPKKMDSTR